MIYTYVEFVKLGQTGALPGHTKVAPTFLGINGALPSQTMPIPVTTLANHDATILHWANTWANRGCLQRVLFITVETQTLWLSTWLTTIFDSIPGDSRRLTHTCFQHLRTTREGACSTLFILVCKGSQLL